MSSLSFNHSTIVAGVQRRTFLWVVLLASFSGSITNADISSVDVFRSGVFQQNGNGNSLTDTGYYASADLFSTNANEFASATLSFPGPSSPVLLTASTFDPLHLNYTSPLFINQASMDVSFPTGAYRFDAGAFSTTANYATDHYPASRPFLDSTDYSDLQGMNPAAAFQFHFSPYATGGLANASNIFFGIFDYTLNMSVFSVGFLQPTTTGLVLPANTLAFGHDYGYELIFDNRDQVPSPGALFSAQLGFDYRTQGSFSTALPEPTSMLLLGSTGLGWILTARRKPMI